MKTLPISEITIGARQRKDLGDLDGLAASIADVGLLQPVAVTPGGKLVAGARRLEAVKRLGRTEIQVVVVDGLDAAVMALKAERDENVQRRPFTPSEAVAMGRALEELERPKAKERQKEHGATAPGKPKHTRGNLPQVNGDVGKTRDKVGEAVGLSGRTYEKAKAVVDAAQHNPERFGRLAEQMDSDKKVNGIWKRLQNELKADELKREPSPFPRGPFRVIVVDPPWRYFLRVQDPTHRGGCPYPDMSLDEIKAIPVSRLGHNDAIVWLWTTNTHLPHAFGVLEAWGFEYKCILTWDKQRIGVGDWLRGQTEHCLIGSRGHPIRTLAGQSTLLRAPGREYSRKPDEFFAFVESLCPAPAGGYLELFARATRPGWVAHGNEVNRFQQEAVVA